jgi:hypothetical protein
VPTSLLDLGKRRAKRSRKVPDGPLQKRSAGSAATEHGAKGRKNQKSRSQNKNTKTGPKAQDAEHHFLWVTHGQETVGFIEQVGTTYAAQSLDGHALGTFCTLKAASDAVSASYSGCGS